MGWQSHPRLQQLLTRNFKKGSSEEPQDNTLKIQHINFIYSNFS